MNVTFGCHRSYATGTTQERSEAAFHRLSDPLLDTIDFNKRYTLSGFSVLPPRGDGWTHVPSETFGQYKNNILAFAKGTQRNSVVAAAMWEYLDLPHRDMTELLQRASQYWEARLKSGEDWTAPKSELRDYRSVLVDFIGKKCLRYDYTTTKQSVPQNSEPRLSLSVHGYACTHPDWPQFLIKVQHSNRYPDGESEISDRSEIDHFLQSLMYQPLPFDTDFKPSVTAVDKSPFDLLSAYGAIWVAQAYSKSLARIDPASSEITHRIQFDAVPSKLVAANGAIWVLDRGGSITRINPSTYQIVTTIETGHLLRYISTDGNLLWLSADNGVLLCIDTRTNQVVGKPRKVGKRLNGLVTSGGYLWVAEYSDGGVWRIDFNNSAFNKIFIPTAPGALNVVYGAGAIWVSNDTDSSVSRIDPNTSSVVAKMAVKSRPAGLYVSEDTVWITNLEEGVASRIDIKTNRVAEKPVPLGVRPIPVISDGTHIWVGNTGSNTVWRLHREK